MYAELCNFENSCCTHQGSDQPIGNEFENGEEMERSSGVQVKAEGMATHGLEEERDEDDLLETVKTEHDSFDPMDLPEEDFCEYASSYQHQEEEPPRVGMFSCTVCRLHFTTEDALQQHLNKDHDVAVDPKYAFCECSQCSYGPTTPDDLNEEAVKCEESGYKRDYEHPRPEPRSSTCQECIETHTDEPRYKCTACGRAFIRPSHLKKHMTTHGEDRPYKCATCHKSFTHSVHCQQHMKMHSERPYKCATCGKTFILSSHLKTHMKIHSGECLYKCTTCGKGFVHSAACRAHMRVHSRECPYKCDTCGKAFIYLSTYWNHKSQLHS
uniref:zinc finger protein 57-like isoform X1 n=2 Tax=Myxine glutinosa TaxID=7769 RepID=UPI00358FAB6B